MSGAGPGDLDGVPLAEFAFPGPLRDKLVAAVLDGTKTSTTALLCDYQLDDAPLPRPGDRWVLVDSDSQPVALLEVTDVRVVALSDVDEAHARDEGEGHDTVARWRAGHEGFWHSEAMRTVLGDPQFTVDDDTPVVLERFRVLRRCGPTAADPGPAGGVFGPS